MVKGLLLVALTLGIGYSSQAVASDVPEACRAAVKGELQRLNIDAARIESLSVVPRISNKEIGSISGYGAWVSLAETPGSLVMNLSRYCRIMDVYARGGFKP